MNDVQRDAKIKTDQLLDQYHAYEIALSRLNDLETKLMQESAQVAKDLQLSMRDLAVTPEAQARLAPMKERHAAAKQRAQRISDEMTYANPIVWIWYKYLAYQNTPQAITTMADFRQHCAKPGYICTKRYQFLNQYLKTSSGIDLNDHERFPNDLTIDQLAVAPEIEAAATNDTFRADWDAHEYLKDGPRVAKWENFTDVHE